MKIISDAESTRLDKYLSEKTDKTRSFIQKAIEQGLVLVNGKVAQAKTKLHAGDEIQFEEPEIKNADIIPQDIPLEIVYEDDFVLVINKPKGMVVHPAPGNPDNTLVNAIMSHCEGRLSTINSVVRPGIVHRIDKDTSGLLVIAKNDESHNALAEQFKVHSIERVYKAVVKGNFKENSGTINAPIGRHPVHRKKMAVTDKNSKAAVTHFKVLESFNGYTLIECRLETGRTHQIRVHLNYIGHTLLGDTLYGDKNKLGVEGQVLHAGVLGFNHPETNEFVRFESPLPEEFENILTELRSL
ncbi:MAG: RluA family pseudouridine synthase [Clostridia bacterium]|nr:RluA family pseudouridine synthase [Clostridia bacterium]